MFLKMYSMSSLCMLAFYDADLVSYQNERNETELEKTFEDRRQQITEQGRVHVADHLRPKQEAKVVPEWQKMVKQKKSDDYYNQLQQLETDQMLRETKLREESHQLGISGEKVVNNTVSKNAAQRYQNNLYVFITFRRFLSVISHFLFCS